jgi:Fe-S-cluster containining protein
MSAAPPLKPRRPDIPPGRTPCDYCTAKCCRYFALPIQTPRTRSDFEFLRWYLLHDAATVFVEEGSWYLLVHTTCKHLRDDNRCGIYETRPEICREYSSADCEYEDDYCYEQYFETPEQVEDYMEAVLPASALGRPVDRGVVRSRRPDPLAVISAH